MNEAVHQVANAASPQLNAPAVSAASFMIGMGTVLQWIPPIAGAISSIVGVFLAVYLLLHRRSQMRIDSMTERKLKAETELAEIALKKAKKEG